MIDSRVVPARGRSATGDDRPKPAEGSPSGETYGGSGGHCFRDRAMRKLFSIKVRSGSLVDAVQCTWSEADKLVPGDVNPASRPAIALAGENL